MRGNVRFIVAVAALLSLAGAKRATGTVKVTSLETEQYIAKFSFVGGSLGTVAGTLSTKGTYLDGHYHQVRDYIGKRSVLLELLITAPLRSLI